MNATDNAIKTRHPTEQDLPAIFANQARTFGDPIDQRDIEAWKRRVDVDNMLVAEDFSDPQRSFLVGSSIIYPTQLTVPGGARLRAAWLTMIAVASTHQGKGVWGQLSAQGLGILIERGYPIVFGAPTQTAMYDGFGAGVASYLRSYSVDRRFAKLRDKPSEMRAREIGPDEAKSLVPEIYQRWCDTTSGAVDRDDAWWADYLEDRPTQRGNGTALNYTIHPDGFLTYRVVGDSNHGYRPPLGTVVVEDFCPITDEAHTELLQTLLVLEMFDTVEIDVPVDDPLPLKLTDPRAAETTGVNDFLWVRINDVAEVLGTRAYAADIEIALEADDPLGLAGGRFLLQARDGVGKCTPHDGPVDVKIGLADLATIYMGAHSASELLRAGRITELRPGAIPDLDAAFSTDRAPFCGTLF
ncbi:acetyltransferase [Mycobacterium sp. E3251]|uniref:GNAT family N-acetyltransferase n=1 Tax=Mycobacterium sp. E3251 TaxID=1834144 RepID=UPI000800FEE8|nr:GNAT family N-acetyltransferase [Mycobacterium sp. E3251]OBG97629.1 acetyltransferase [Mycobacterium sp. E3251]